MGRKSGGAKLALLASVLVFSLGAGSAEQSAKESPFAARLLFYCSYDERFSADAARGDPSARDATTRRGISIPAELTEGSRGLRGEALEVTGETAYAIYASRGNVDRRRGTVCFWTMPIEWSGARTNTKMDLRAFWCWPNFGQVSVVAVFKPPQLAFWLEPPQGSPNFECQTEPSLFEPNKWRHIAITWDASRDRKVLYVDGAKKSEGAFDYVRKDPFNVFFVGGAHGGRQCGGLVDELRIYNVALDPDQLGEVIAFDKRPEAPAPRETPPDRPGNLVRNSSFELDYTGWWVPWYMGRPQFRPAPATPEDTFVRYDDGAHGTKCFDLTRPWRHWLTGFYTEVTRGKRYTVSAYLKAKRANTTARLLFLSGLNQTEDTESRYGLRRGFTVGTEWKRYHVSGVLDYPKLPDPRNVQHFFNVSVIGNVLVDAVQVEEGPLTDYAPGGTVEATPMVIGNRAQIFEPGEEVNVEGWVCTEGLAGKPAELTYAVVGYHGEDVLREAHTIVVPPGGFARDPWSFRATRKGFLRVQLTARCGGEVGRGQTFISVLPRLADRPEWIEKSLFGGHVATKWPHAHGGDEANSHYLDMMHRTGVRWIRLHDFSSPTRWDIVQPEEGRFTFRDSDWIIDTLKARGFELLGSFNTVPPWVAERKTYRDRWKFSHIASSPKALGAWTKYVETVVRRYKDKIRYWEVWNEPDACYADPAAREGSGQDYYRICRAAHDAARGADPEARLVVGVMCHPLEVGAKYDIFPDAFAAGLRKYLDVFSYHHYSILARDSRRERDQLHKTIHGIRRLLGEAETCATPLWNSEQGVESEDPHFGASACYPFVFGAGKVSVEAAVAGVVAGHVAGLAEGVERVFAYAFMPQSRMLHPDGCPLSPFTYDNLPKPWLAARAILATLLEGASYRGELKLHDRLECHLLDTPKGMLAVLWGYTKQPDTCLQADESAPLNGTWLDVMGNPLDDERIRKEGLPIGPEPVYCLFPAEDRPTWEKNLARAKLRGLLPLPLEEQWAELGVARPPGWEGEVARVVPLELGPLAFGYVVAGDGDELACYLWATAGEDRAKLDRVDLLPSERVAAGRDQTAIGKGIPLLRQGAWILSSSAETSIHDLRRRVEKGTLTGWEPLTMTARALPNEHGEPVILLDILSQWNTPLALESLRAGASSPLALRKGEWSRGALALAPGASRPFTLRLRGWPPASCEGTLSLTARITGQRDLVLSDPLRIAVAKRAEKAIVVDGVPDEQWRGSRPIHIGTRSQVRVGAENGGGKEDCSGEARFLWDRSRLYALVEARDDVIRPAAGKQLWKGDAAELFFALAPWKNRHQTSYTNDHHQFLFAPEGRDGTPAARWTGSAGHGEGAKDTDLPQVASSLAGNSWAMEIAIPWRHLRRGFSPQAGEVIGMDAAIDDVDKDPDIRVQAVWNGTQDNYRDPSHFGLLVLRE